MKKILIIITIALSFSNLNAQYRTDLREKAEDNRQLGKVSAPIDRAQNVININRLGQVVTNMGQWHPYTGVFPRGRWPITTNHDQTYKMSLFVGIPYNVAHARGNGTKEWDPLPGNHNPVTGKIASVFETNGRKSSTNVIEPSGLLKAPPLSVFPDVYETSLNTISPALVPPITPPL